MCSATPVRHKGIPLLNRKKSFQSLPSLLNAVGDLTKTLVLRCCIAVMTSSWARVPIMHNAPFKAQMLAKTARARDLGIHLWKLYFASCDPQENTKHQLPSKV